MLEKNFNYFPEEIKEKYYRQGTRPRWGDKICKVLQNGYSVKFIIFLLKKLKNYIIINLDILAKLAIISWREV